MIKGRKWDSKMKNGMISERQVIIIEMLVMVGIEKYIEGQNKKSNGRGLLQATVLKSGV
jgi:hypothetical protein